MGLDFGGLFNPTATDYGNIRYEVSSSIPASAMMKNGEIIIWESDKAVTGEFKTDNMGLLGNNFTSTTPIRQKFTVGKTGTNLDQNIDNITLRMKRIGDCMSVTGILELYAADGSGNPTGALLSRGEWAGSTCSTSFANVAVVISPPLFVSQNAIRVMKLNSTGDDANNYLSVDDTSSVYAGGEMKLWNGTAWVNPASAVNIYF